jgi:hypothetical protein
VVTVQENSQDFCFTGVLAVRNGITHKDGVSTAGANAVIL